MGAARSARRNGDLSKRLMRMQCACNVAFPGVAGGWPAACTHARRALGLQGSRIALTLVLVHAEVHLTGMPRSAGQGLVVRAELGFIQACGVITHTGHPGRDAER